MLPDPAQYRPGVHSRSRWGTRPGSDHCAARCLHAQDPPALSAAPQERLPEGSCAQAA